MTQHKANHLALSSVVLLLPLLGAHVVFAAPADSELATGNMGKYMVEAFEAFKSQHGRNYEHNSPEHHQRLLLFSQRSAEVEQQNARPGHLWTAGINAFSDRTDSELAQLRGWRGGATRNRGRNSATVTSGGTISAGTFLRQRGKGKSLPRAFMDWTNLTSSQNVKNQGGCGSCWAVATSNVLEAHSEIYKTGRKFSAQEFVDCVPNPRKCGGSGGCAGATVELALHWALNRGVADDDETPYTGENGICRNTKSDSAASLAGGDGFMQLRLDQGEDDQFEDIASPGVHYATHGALGPTFGMRGWERLPENAYEPLLQAIVEHGPVAVSAAANHWYSYYGGIYDGCERDAVIDHAVTLTGFGEDKDTLTMFWLVQNSWGPDWGEQGYIRLLRTDGESEFCGTDNQPEAGTGCAGGPTQVRVCGMCGILYDSAVPHFS